MNYNITSASDAINTISLLTGKNFNKKYGLSKASRHVDEISFYKKNEELSSALHHFRGF
ncbi:MAG: hypothetical protein H6Q58_421 [Firmicutes bacterium]|nr:hypothetical protein [Bacillota bacterium]